MLIFYIQDGILTAATDEFAHALGYAEASQIIDTPFKSLLWPSGAPITWQQIEESPKKLKVQMRHRSGRKSITMQLSFSDTRQFLQRKGKVHIGIASRKGKFEGEDDVTPKPVVAVQEPVVEEEPIREPEIEVSDSEEADQADSSPSIV
jgi:hypothetical protein